MTLREHSKPSSGVIEAVVGTVLLIAGFTAIASSDVSAAGTRAYWAILIGVYGLVALAADWHFRGDRGLDTRSAVRIVLHWLGVLVAIHLIYYFVVSGRFANADTGLANGLILALGTFLAGVHGTWRLAVIGVALAVATAGVAFVEEYLWVLFAAAIAAIAALLLGARLINRPRRNGAEI